MKNTVFALFFSFPLWTCAANTSWNQKLESARELSSRASFVVRDRGRKDVLVLLALSGGGSRAAYFSAQIMLKLEEAGLLGEVDLISSVSGGSLTAAYYCSSVDGSSGARAWNRAVAEELFTRAYLTRGILQCLFNPLNYYRYWFTNFDRSDIMSLTLKNNLFSLNGRPLRIKDLRADRPNLILNATNVTRGRHFGRLFTFTAEDFQKEIGSDVNSYPLYKAVMASAAFPGLFHHMTLMNHKPSEKNRFLHVIDGGVADNLGLLSLARVLSLLSQKNEINQKYKKIVIISADSDAGLCRRGTSELANDPREGRPFSYLIAPNIGDTADSMFSVNYALIRRYLKSYACVLNLNASGKFNVKNLNACLRTRKMHDQSDFVNIFHIRFSNLIRNPCAPPERPIGDEDSRSARRIFKRIDNIGTNLNISADEARAVKQAVNGIGKKTIHSALGKNFSLLKKIAASIKGKQ